jgi:hypothetical protein
MSKTRRLTRHADAQINYRRRLRERRAPERDDIARVVLFAFTLACHHEPMPKFVRATRQYVIARLVQAGFDEKEVLARFEKQIQVALPAYLAGMRRLRDARRAGDAR